MSTSQSELRCGSRVAQEARITGESAEIADKRRIRSKPKRSRARGSAHQLESELELSSGHDHAFDRTNNPRLRAVK
jgi:hypothetical protein